jgi:hypothetical protein
MAFTVVYDANALVGNTLRDLLVRIAQTGLVQAKWTDRILDEALAAVQKSRPGVAPEKLARVRELMIEADWCGAASSRSRTHGSSDRRLLKTCLASWSDLAWSSPLPRAALGGQVPAVAVTRN